MLFFCTMLRMIKHGKPYLIRRSLRLRPEDRLLLTVENPQKDSGVHDHLFHEIAYIRSGSAEHHTASGIQRIGPGTLIIIRPQVWHAYVNCQKFSVVNCLFNSFLLYQLLPLLTDSPNMTALLRAQPRPPADLSPSVTHVPSKHRAEIEHLLGRIQHEQTHRRAAWQSASTACLLQILVLTARLYKGSTEVDASSPATETAVLAAAHHIEAHLKDSVSLSALAAMTGLSKGHLSRHFSARMGMGIVDYQHRLRIEEACRLLRLTDLSITQIAMRAGYAEIAYFSRCFRKIMGISARDYRHGHHAAKMR